MAVEKVDGMCADPERTRKIPRDHPLTGCLMSYSSNTECSSFNDRIHTPPTRGHIHPISPPSKVDNGQRGGPRYTRGRTGCMTCKEKKIKCDETKPNCLRCAHGQRECTWPKVSPVSHRSAPVRNDKARGSFLLLLFAILEYPPFNKVIHWDGINRVVLEQPQILELYILMPVFGIPALDVFRRRLYAIGFDRVLCRASSQNAHPQATTWEHIKMTKLNPPMGFTSRDWSEEIETDKPIPKAQLDSDEDMLREEPRLRGPVPIPLSAEHGRTLDWSRTEKSDSSTDTSVYLDSIVHHEKKLAAIRSGAKPKVRETASKVAEDLQRRYDLLFLHLENQKPARLTATVRWGISNLKIPARAWKSPVPTQVIEDYLADEPDHRPASSIPEDWVQVVNKFISRCDYLGKVTESESEPEPHSRGDRPQVSSRPSSRASSISEGHVSPEDDVPSKKVVCYDVVT